MFFCYSFLAGYVNRQKAVFSVASVSPLFTASILKNSLSGLAAYYREDFSTFSIHFQLCSFLCSAWQFEAALMSLAQFELLSIFLLSLSVFSDVIIVLGRILSFLNICPVHNGGRFHLIGCAIL